MLSGTVPNFCPKKVLILYTSPKFHPHNEMPRQSPKFKILDGKHCKPTKPNPSNRLKQSTPGSVVPLATFTLRLENLI